MAKFGGPKQAKAKDQSTKTVSSDADGKRAGVKAMAAFFEEPENPAESSSMRVKQVERGLQNMANKAALPLKPTTTSSPKPPQAPWSAKSANSNATATAKPADDPHVPRLRNSVSDSVALRAAALIEAEKQHQGPSTERLPLARLRQGILSRKPEPQAEAPKDFQSQMKVGQSLGTMTPHQEQPPIAQHLNLTRPPSTASLKSVDSGNNNLDQSLDSVSGPRASTPLMRPSSTTSLHSQVRNLQRQLGARTEEAAQLRRQVEAQEGTDIGTLSEQLREAKREAQMWKERAEAAERRLKVFERFTSRLKGIREAAAAADQRSVMDEDLTDPEDASDCGECRPEGNSSPDNQRVRFLEGRRTKAFGSDDSGKTEDAGVVQARIRKCLHGGRNTAAASTADGSSDLVSYDGTSKMIDLQDGGAWMTADELLDRA